MSFTDIFKKSFLDGFNTNLSLITIFVVLLVALGLGIFIYFIYKLKIKGPFYSKDFNQVLIGLPIITAAIVLSMQANIVVSLGMVGALSIVRFRNAVKNSMDLLYLFWAISVGIICGAQIYPVAFMLTGILTIAIFVFDLIPYKSNSYLVVCSLNKTCDSTQLLKQLKQVDKGVTCRSCVVNATGQSCIYELTCKDINKIQQMLSALNGIESFNIVLNDGMNRIG